jgi:hypothetical protein
MLLRVADKPVSGDELLDAMRTGRGDVIVICPDGWQWSQAELSNPEWAIVKLPGVDPALLVAFTQPDNGDPAQGTIPQRRAFRFNVDAWDTAGRPILSTLAAVLALRIARAPRKHSSILG